MGSGPLGGGPFVLFQRLAPIPRVNKTILLTADSAPPPGQLTKVLPHARLGAGATLRVDYASYELR